MWLRFPDSRPCGHPQARLRKLPQSSQLLLAEAGLSCVEGPRFILFSFSMNFTPRHLPPLLRLLPPKCRYACCTLHNRNACMIILAVPQSPAVLRLDGE